MNMMKYTILHNGRFSNFRHVLSTKIKLSSTTTIAVKKLRSAVESYRLKNFTAELPSRCKKEIVYAADVNKDGQIPLEGFMKIIKNIGATSLISKQDILYILSELGEESRSHTTIAKEKMNQIL